MTHGMVCAPQPEAVEAGVLALRRGGNAVDAAICCALVQTVVDPQMCGIAGMGSMHLHLPDKNHHQFIDFYGRAPLKTTPDMWEDILIGEAQDGFGFALEGAVNDVGYQAVTAPGSLLAYFTAIERHGTMDWKDIMAPAIKIAEEGFKVRPYMSTFWNEKMAFGLVGCKERLAFTQAGRDIYFKPDGTLLEPGEVLKNPDMARTLKRISEGGIDIFYRGEIADEIVADMERHGGLLGKADLENYQLDDNEPLWGDYRGYRIATNPPPGGGIMVLQMLNILEHFDLRALGHNSPEYIRIVAEAMKLATIDKDAHIGDPKFVDVPVERLLSDEYAAQCAQAIRNGEIAHVPRVEQTPESKETTHICAVDDHGNTVSMTHTLGMPSGALTKGLGFMYNGCMSVFDPRPGHSDSLAPGKARFTAMAPSIVYKDDKPVLVIGAPGGTYITMGVLQGILNVIDFDMSAQSAVAAPRICATSDIIDVVNRIPRYVTDEVASYGYEVRRSHKNFHFAGVHAIKLTDGKWEGGADPGRDGVALEV